MTAVVDKIVRVTEAQAAFWSRAHGWAPTAAAGLLSKSRLDRQCSLARTLKDYAKRPPPDEEDARFILAYVNLAVAGPKRINERVDGSGWGCSVAEGIRAGESALQR
jgi:hypothetical protein